MKGRSVWQCMLKQKVASCLIGAEGFSSRADRLNHQGTVHTRRQALAVGDCEGNGVHTGQRHVVATGTYACACEQIPAHGSLGWSNAHMQAWKQWQIRVQYEINALPECGILH